MVGIRAQAAPHELTWAVLIPVFILCAVVILIMGVACTQRAGRRTRHAVAASERFGKESPQPSMAAASMVETDQHEEAESTTKATEEREGGGVMVAITEEQDDANDGHELGRQDADVRTKSMEVKAEEGAMVETMDKREDPMEDPLMARTFGLWVLGKAGTSEAMAGCRSPSPRKDSHAGAEDGYVSSASEEDTAYSDADGASSFEDTASSDGPPSAQPSPSLRSLFRTTATTSGAITELARSLEASRQKLQRAEKVEEAARRRLDVLQTRIGELPHFTDCEDADENENAEDASLRI